MDILNWNQLSKAEQEKALQRPAMQGRECRKAVGQIITAIRENGDEAIREFSNRFDGVVPAQLQTGQNEIETAWAELDDEHQSAMRRAHDNIARFHRAQLPKDLEIEVEPGLVCKRLARPLDCVGIYVPGGSAPLFSSLLMAAIPAKLANVGRIIAASPPGRDGKVAPIILAAAKLCGIDEVYCVGGAQAVAAMAFGTKSIPRVDKVFGPGNQWVSEAKTQVTQITGGPAIDLPAGPSEVMVLADERANPAWVAADLLSQAEHDPQAHLILLCLSTNTAKTIEHEVLQQLNTLSRADIARAALGNARLIVVKSVVQMLDIANTYAPEHLIIQIEGADEFVPEVRNAGSVFIGAYTPEALGDYASGTNHVLPTAGAARAYSGLGTQSFMKFITVQRATQDALVALGPTVQTLAQLEGLEAHANAITLRLGNAL